MTCASCVAHVGRALRKVPGVQEADVNLATERASVTYREGASLDALVAAVEGAGYGARVLEAAGEDADARERQRELRRKRSLLVLGAILTIPVVVMGMTPQVFAGKDFLMFALTLPVWLVVGWDFHRGALASARHGSANMDTLVSLGSTVAFGYSIYATLAMRPAYYETAAAIVTLIFAGKYLETAAKSKSNLAIRALLDLRPPMARVRLADGRIDDLPAERVRQGDLLVVAAGERIPVDGIVEEGRSSVDAAMLTGEPLPVAAEPGTSVKQGTLNGEGTLLVRASAVGSGTTLAHIIDLVRRAQGSTPPVQRLADRIAGVFVPAILAIAALTFAGWLLTGHAWSTALPVAIAVIVVACPCALGLATPMAVIAGVGLGARNGVLFRDALAIERMSAIRTVLFDKTGTLTAGSPQVSRVVPSDGVSEDELIAAAAAIESGSKHPLARAVLAEADARGVRSAHAANVLAVPGAGISGEIGGETYRAGTAAYLRSSGIALEDAAETLTCVYVAQGTRPLGRIDFADVVKPHAAEAVALLHERGLRVGVVSGDAPSPTEAIARSVRADDWYAAQTPERKAAVVNGERSKGGAVAFVGDGINDAPALAQADVGIAMGSGSEVALETAQAAILSNDPRAVDTALRISRATLAKIRQNLFWAMIYNAVLVPVAALGYIHPIFAAAAMGASSLFVAGNSYLLQRTRLTSDG